MAARRPSVRRYWSVLMVGRSVGPVFDTHLKLLLNDFLKYGRCFFFFPSLLVLLWVFFCTFAFFLMVSGGGEGEKGGGGGGAQTTQAGAVSG